MNYDSTCRLKIGSGTLPSLHLSDRRALAFMPKINLAAVRIICLGSASPIGCIFRYLRLEHMQPLNRRVLLKIIVN